MGTTLCRIDEKGCMTLPSEIAEAFRQKGIHNAIVVQTWDGYRLEPISDEDADAMRADERAMDPIAGALLALTGGSDTE